jgi:arsenate reductase-like glutaredoxin family protein
MRFFEIQSIKPVKPLTPAQARLRSLKQQIENGKRALAAERERQSRQAELERQQKSTKALLGKR